MNRNHIKNIEVDEMSTSELIKELKQRRSEVLDCRLDIKTSRQLLCDWYNNGTLAPIDVSQYLNKTKFNFVENENEYSLDHDTLIHLYQNTFPKKQELFKFKRELVIDYAKIDYELLQTVHKATFGNHNGGDFGWQTVEVVLLGLEKVMNEHPEMFQKDMGDQEQIETITTERDEYKEVLHNIRHMLIQANMAGNQIDYRLELVSDCLSETQEALKKEIKRG